MVRLLALASLAMVIVAEGGCRRLVAPPPQPVNPASIHLQSGFDGSPVTIKYDGKVIFSGTPKTRETLGIAEVFTFDRGESAADVLVLEYKGKSYELHIDWAKGRVIGISVVDGQTRLRQAIQGFGYD